MIKLFATSITILSGLSLGAMICKTEKKAIEEREKLSEFISYILWNIESRATPLFEIFEDYFSKENSDFSKKLREARGKYGDKIRKVWKEICPKEQIDELESFFSSLGKTDRETQIKMAKKAKEALESSLSEKKKEYASKSRLYLALPFLISCVAAVLLY